LQSFGVATLEIPAAGHNVHVEQPALVARGILEFVSNTPA
jgi:pimeloyl-ACP methyl ester carboxylesterase